MNPFWHCWWLESNLVQFVELWWENNQRYFLCGEMFFFSFFLILFSYLVKFLSCKYYDVFYYYYYYYFLFIIFFPFLIDWPACESVLIPNPHTNQQPHPPPPLEPFKWVTFMHLVPARRWRKIDIFTHFCTRLKKKQFRKVSQYKELPYQCCIECTTGCWTKERHLDS